MQVLAIQQALQARGFDLGPTKADGIWGRASIGALRAFQNSQQLPATGVADSATLTAMFDQRTSSPVRPSPVWYEEALRLKGLHESAGPANNPTILGWARRIGGWVAKSYTTDSTPWCGLFASHCIAATLPDEKLPANPLSALAWNKFGTRLPSGSLGAICVFTRTGGGHVAFYAGEDETTIHTVGGNQADAVTLTRIPKSRLAGFRWPSTAPQPSGGRVVLTASGSLSRSEA